MSDTDKIVAYIRKNRVMTLATAHGSTPWTANCFYAFDEPAMALLFMSETTTRHGRELCGNGAVAGTISSQEASIARLRGIQFSGMAAIVEADRDDRRRALYLRRFPVARLRPAPLWAVRLDLVKYTDNTLGFGTKLHWKRTP